MLTSKQLQECKSVLVTRQGELIKQLQGSFGLEMSHIDAVGELSSYDNHPADMGTELFERGKDVALEEHAEMELEQINLALHAISAGTYAICRECSQDIPYERLLAVPTTDACIEHAEQGIFTSNRPIEETVYSPNLNPNTEAEEIDNAYDAEDAYQDVARYGNSDTPSDLYGDRDNYDDMYPNSDENIGYVEDVEKYSRTGFEA